MTSDTWTIRNLYLYAVCLITLIIGLIAAGQLAGDLLDLAWPEPTYVYDCVEIDVATGSCAQEMSPATVEMQRTAEQDRQQRWALRSAITSAAMLVIAGGAWFYHWRKIQHDRADKTSDPA